jgi:small subunit ribosomal protein S1
VRGFLPASLVDIRRVQNLDDFLGQKIECKVIELNRSRNNVVLSRRAVLEEERKEVRQQILDKLQPGMIVEGAISNIVDFGAFVDLDGIDGLIHISELSWSHVNHPSEILAIGDVVPVKVLDIDRVRQRISLGLKQTQEDPWQRVIDTYRVGDELEGKVTKVVTFGAFVEIMEGVEGLVHISELAHHHVENPREIVEPDQDVRVKILEIDSERRRLSLSVKRVQDQLEHIRDATAASAPAEAPDQELGDVPDLALSEDVFAGAQIEGAADLRAALAAQQPEDEVVFSSGDEELAAADAEPGPEGLEEAEAVVAEAAVEEAAAPEAEAASEEVSVPEAEVASEETAPEEAAAPEAEVAPEETAAEEEGAAPEAEAAVEEIAAPEAEVAEEEPAASEAEEAPAAEQDADAAPEAEAGDEPADAEPAADEDQAGS